MFSRSFTLLAICALLAHPLGAANNAATTYTNAIATPAPRVDGSDSLFVPILVYHGIFPHHPGQTVMQRAYDVAPEAFEAHMQYLHDHDFHVISFGTLVEALETGKKLDPRSVVITFDDGRENQYVHAFPVLKKFGYTATFFIYPNPVGRKDDFMTWDQIREMAKAGMTIGSHTYTHPYLTKITDPKEMKREIEGSRALLEKQLGVKIEYLAYPFGMRNAEIEVNVQRAGYRAARIFPGGKWQSRAKLFSLRGLQIEDSMKGFERAVEPAAARK